MGITRLDHIVTDHPGTEVVPITAVQDIEIATNAGAADYLLKPFEPRAT